MGQPVEIVDIQLPGLASDQLWGCSLDGPRIGDGVAGRSTSYELEVRGWVLGRRLPAVAIELQHDGSRLWRVPLDVKRPEIAASYPDVPGSDSSGFYVPLNCLSLSLEFELSVRAVLEDETRVDVATVRGRRRPLRSTFEPRLQPLMVTTIGRTGSSMLVQLLGAHPEILAYRPFEVEPRVASYWLGVLKSLSEPASYRRQITEARNLLNPAWWLGTEGPLPRRIRDPELADWMGTTNVEALAAFCQSRIEAIYEQIAARSQRPNALYFAEKYLPEAIPAMMWELYPQAREVVLVRDFRDMICSMLAFNAKRGLQGFGRDRAESDAGFVQEIGERASALARQWERRSEQAHLLRYEDLVLRPEEALRATLRYLGVDSQAATVEEMRSSLSSAIPEAESHRTSGSGASASVGRWHRDLSPDLKQACEQAFRPALERFGYPLELASR
jgi:hypothetical protein